MSWLLAALFAAAAIGWFALRGRTKTAPTTAYAMRLPMPRAGVGGPRCLRAHLDPRAADWAAALRELRTRVVLTDGLGGRGVVAVVSSHADASTLLAANFALALGQLGDALLIELGGPGLSADPALLSEPVGADANRAAGPWRWPSGMIDLWVSDGREAELTPRVRELTSQYEWIVVDLGQNTALAQGLADVVLWAGPSTQEPPDSIVARAQSAPPRWLLLGLDDTRSR